MSAAAGVTSDSGHSTASVDDTVTIAQNLGRNCGWHVFPARANKKPACEHGFKDAGTDPDRIAYLWRNQPGPLIGVATGAVSGFDVLDIDLKHDAALHWWHTNHVAMPVTRTYRTRSGGLHLFFVHQVGLSCSAGKICAGIDIRADKGYIISWFAAGFECLDHASPAPWPAALIAALLPKPTPPPAGRSMSPHHQERAIDGSLRLVAAAPEGQRNALLFWAACRLSDYVRKDLLDVAEAERLLVGAAMAAGLKESEARTTALSGLRRAPG
jgi:hypothetical protein